MDLFDCEVVKDIFLNLVVIWFGVKVLLEFDINVMMLV